LGDRFVEGAAAPVRGKPVGQQRQHAGYRHEQQPPSCAA
jgi:hypothetical protein